MTSLKDFAYNAYIYLRDTDPTALTIIANVSVLSLAILFWIILYLLSPFPRPPRPSEKTYVTALPNGKPSEPRALPCWYDVWRAKKQVEQKDVASGKKKEEDEVPAEAAEVFMSVVVPAFNEQERIGSMLEEAVVFLERSYGRDATIPTNPHANTAPSPLPGWEILVVSDGSTDKTAETVLAFSHKHKIASDSIRIITLEENRGKGGAVTHGMRHVRGQYAVFADADGASKFDNLADLVRVCQKIEDPNGRAVAIGSRAHLVGSEAVVKRSLLRNTLMHAFHLLIRLLTPSATSRIADTQCGFKLFSRPALPYIIPYMHSEGWIFDIEMLMLTESAEIPMEEVAIGWKEIPGSKLNVVWASLGMAWGLAQLRAAWALGVYVKA